VSRLRKRPHSEQGQASTWSRRQRRIILYHRSAISTHCRQRLIFASVWLNCRNYKHKLQAALTRQKHKLPIAHSALANFRADFVAAESVARRKRRSHARQALDFASRIWKVEMRPDSIRVVEFKPLFTSKRARSSDVQRRWQARVSKVSDLRHTLHEMGTFYSKKSLYFQRKQVA
jgi:hypothetical protein